MSNKRDGGEGGGAWLPCPWCGFPEVKSGAVRQCSNNMEGGMDTCLLTPPPREGVHAMDAMVHRVVATSSPADHPILCRPTASCDKQLVLPPWPCTPPPPPAPPSCRNADALEYMGVALSLLLCCPSGCGPDAKQTAMMQQAKAARESAVSS